MDRTLNLSNIPDALLAEYGLVRGGAVGTSYQCDDPNALLIPLQNVYVASAAQNRRLNEDAVRSLLSGIREGVALPPVQACLRSAARTQLTAGMHRWRISQAMGYAMIPCILISIGEADEFNPDI